MLLRELFGRHDEEEKWNKQGYHSFFKGVLQRDNPYTLNTKAWRAWNQGWKNADTNADEYNWYTPDAISQAVDTMGVPPKDFHVS